MNILVRNIKGLVQVEDTPRSVASGGAMNHVPVLNDAWLLIKNGCINDFGTMDSCPSVIAKKVDATGCFVFPSFVDSHTHMVYARSRETEFEQRIQGMSQEEIEAEGGGICRSAALLREVSEEALFQKSKVRLERVIQTGTGAMEIKSGYGLGLESELKILRVIRRLRDTSPIPIKATFMGAHAIPMSYRDHREDYIRLLLEDMLPCIAEEGLADYIDAFCDRGFFTPEETDQILQAGIAHGLEPKLHTNELCDIGGVAIGCNRGVLSMDGLVHMTEDEVARLHQNGAIATLLPGPSFFANLAFPNARALIDGGLPVALASDYNPGTAPSGNLCFIFSLACIKLGMTVEEALNALTINAAAAIRMQTTLGSIARGKMANVFITAPIPSIAYLPYSFGNNLIETIILNGKIVEPGKATEANLHHVLDKSKAKRIERQED